MKYTVVCGDGFNVGEYDDLKMAIKRADEIAGWPDSKESREVAPRRLGNAVYAVRSDQPGGRWAQVNQNP